jgi:Dolichyl-phosphate-mannose-protein mannosyltransferase
MATVETARAKRAAQAPPRAPETTRRGTHLRWGLAVAGLMLVGLGLRLWGIKQGLPYAYNIDENAHFVPRAIGFFGHTLNPFYFVNPPGYTNLLYVVFSVWFGGGDATARAYAVNPTEVYVVARVTSAVLGTLAIWFMYLAGAKLVDRRAGLLAAALMTVAFLPVFYSHLALNDTPTLAPAALSLYGIALIYRRGRWYDFALAGAAAGVATAVKYTAAIFILPICIAAYFRWRDELDDAAAAHSGEPGRRAGVPAAGPRPRPLPPSLRRALRWTGNFLKARAFLLLCLAGVATIAGFVFASPYSLLDPKTFGGGIIHQATASSTEGKLGQTFDNGYLYYLWSVTWGLGWVPALASVAGAFALARTRNRVFWLLVPAAILYILFMGSASRWFGRWLMPLFPVLCLLAAVGVLYVADVLTRRWPRARYAFVAVAAIALLAQGIVYSVHSDRLLARADTRALVRNWMVQHLPASTKVAYEPVIPDSYYRPPGFFAPPTNEGNRWNIFVADDTPQSALTATSRVAPSVLGLPNSLAGDQFLARLGVSLMPAQLPDTVLPNRRKQDVGVVGGEGYTRDLSPALIDVYRDQGVCYVVSGSIQSQRALVQPEKVPDAVAYYRALRRHADPVFVASPYAKGAKPVKFNFDWSFDYYPMAYDRPGPFMTVWKLKRCSR